MKLIRHPKEAAACFSSRRHAPLEKEKLNSKGKSMNRIPQSIHRYKIDFTFNFIFLMH